MTYLQTIIHTITNDLIVFYLDFHVYKHRRINVTDNMVTKLERYATNLENIVAERTAALVDEKRKTDALLHKLLPPYVTNACSYYL